MVHRLNLGSTGTGATNAEIAARLFMSGATARTHVSRVMSTLGARDRAQLVVIACETGLVSPGADGPRIEPPSCRCRWAVAGKCTSRGPADPFDSTWCDIVAGGRVALSERRSAA